MDRLIQLRDIAGAPVQAGVTVNSAYWVDSGTGTPAASVAVVSATNGLWRVTVADPSVSRGPAGVLLSYDDGTGIAFRPLVEVPYNRLNTVGDIVNQAILYSPVEQNPSSAWVVIPKGSGLPIEFYPKIEMPVDPQYLLVKIGILGAASQSFSVALANMEVDAVTGRFKIIPAIAWTNSLTPGDDRIVGDVLRTGPTDRNKGFLRRLRVQVMATL